MLENVLWQIARTQLSFPPLVDGYVDIGNRAAQRRSVLSGKAVQIVGSRAGKLVGLADVRPGLKQNGSNHFCNILCSDRGCAPRTERKPDAAVAADLLGSPSKKEKVLLEYRGPHMHNRQPRPVQGLLGKPMLTLLRRAGPFRRFICETVICDMCTSTSMPPCSRAAAPMAIAASR